MGQESYPYTMNKSYKKYRMKKLLIAASLLFATTTTSLMAQEKVSPEQKLITEYYDLLLKQKDNTAAQKAKIKLLKKFPQGKFARRLASDSISAMQGEAFYAAAEQFRRNFPIEEWYKNPDDQGFTFVNFYRSYSNTLWREKRYDKLVEVMAEMEFNMLVDLYRHGPMFLIMKAPVDPKEYVDISRKMIDAMYAKKDQKVDMYGMGNAETGQGQNEQMYYYLGVETEILQRSERYSEAVECMEKIPADVRCGFYPQGNQAYVTSLEQLGRHDEAVKALESSAGTGLMTGELHTLLKKHYQSMAVKPAATFDEYFNSLKKPIYLENIKSSVARGMVDEPYAAFSLTGINGEEVNSASFSKDDIVIIDFWATWCAPCIAALEGMQMAVDKYKTDPHVKFYFVCTQEEPDTDRVNGVWKRKNLHDMLVLFDCGKQYSDVYKSMFKGTSAIPQKAILKDGRIRYRAEGYSGSPSQLMDEIVAIVELLKEE